MNRRLPQFALLVLATLCGARHCRAQGGPVRYPLTGNSIANALTVAGASVIAADIALPSAMTATAPSPQLALQSAGLSGPTQLRVRVTCSVAGQCLPFMVIADLHDNATALAALHLLAPRNTAGAPGAQTAADLLRAGQHATLLLEDDRMRISLPVISLDSGAPGTQIRVASLDRKQTYRGVVSDATTVRGALP